MTRKERVLATAPRLAAVAYIIPDIHGDQVATLAKYPIVIVPQQSSQGRAAMRTALRERSPDTLILGYQVLAEQMAGDRGPGDNVLFAYDGQTPDLYMRSGSGANDPVTINPSNGRKLIDYRKPEWQAAILSAIDAMMESFPYNGLFLDNCTVFQIHHPESSVRNELLAALRTTILAIRDRYPHLILIGNTAYKFHGLNGEMNEANPSGYPADLPTYHGHAKPEINITYVRLSSSTDDTTWRSAAKLITAYGTHCFVAAGVDYQHVLWLPTCDDMVQTKPTL